MGTMGFFSASLGMNCTDCHVDESGGNWAKYADDNALKQTARRMMRWWRPSTRRSFGGRQVVTCNTCHRGTRRPNVMPSLALLYGTPPPDEPGDPFQQAPGQPPADQVLDKYRAGASAERSGWSALRASSPRAPTKASTTRRRASLEIFAQVVGPAQHDRPHAVGRQHDHVRRPRRLDRGAGNREAGAASGDHRAGSRRRQAGSGAVVSRADQAGARQVARRRAGDRSTIARCNPSRARPPAAGRSRCASTRSPACWCAWSGSPSRRSGASSRRIDYSDYRDVSGIKMPFRWTVSWLDGRSMFELTDVRPNVAIDAAKFAQTNGRTMTAEVAE